MTVYADAVILLNFLIDYLLLLATNRLCGYSCGRGRMALAATVGAVYSGACLLPGMAFLGNAFWRLVSLAVMCAVAFGFCKNTVRKTAVFTILSMALGGMALGLEVGGFFGLLTAAGGICLMCVAGFRDRIGSVTYVPVELNYGGKKVRLTALHDTGNSLTDPVTGKPVLVVDPKVAECLTGLTRQQLSKPVEYLAESTLPGLRLVPYRSVGQDAGFLLALRIPDVKIGRYKGSSLVAFAPNGLSNEGTYQALTGGAA